ncbi:hypothetical protein SLEP1_g1666 [Rubroshorea leprosula]|uniref:Transmembrane protein n=1 Tax=Rubroshorea leprosula TaxID=152421 RepID=A0AAV5HEH1_9ROSI|nr:hypothetical protein SLEP1_g1666 [Rubroshorea leprosula]
MSQSMASHSQGSEATSGNRGGFSYLSSTMKERLDSATVVLCLQGRQHGLNHMQEGGCMDAATCDFERCTEMLKDEMARELECRMKAMGDGVCVGVENSVRRLIKNLLLIILVVVVVIIAFVYGQL